MRTHYLNVRVVLHVALLTTLSVIPAGAATSQGVAAERIEGLWVAVAESPGSPAPPVVFRIIRNLDGVPKAFLESPDQTHRNLIDEVAFQDGHLRLEVASMDGAFEGSIQDDGMLLKGTWSQAGQSFPLLLKRTDALPRANRPQEPNRPYPYNEEEVVYQNAKAQVKLAGTLTLPRGTGPFPTVRLIGGSGALNRDDEASGHRTFLVLADYLTRRGLAVLRVDKRGAWRSTGDFATATTRDFADDALASVEYLKRREDIDDEKIGLIGHSEGAMIAQMLAAERPDIRFIVLMAGPGVPLDEAMTTQHCLYAKADGADEDKIALLRDWYKRFYAAAIRESEDAAAAKRIRERYAELSDQQRQMLGWSEGKLDDEINRVLSPWWRYLLAFDPRDLLTKVKCPVLAINGEKDLQVSPAENLRGIADALRAGGNRHHVVQELPSLNHVFQTAETGSESEYARIDETLAPIALETIANWTIEQTTTQP